jgi:bacillithiol biosynthesis cysteine-adding enzyme BshC
MGGSAYLCNPMEAFCSTLPYHKTGAFSKLVTDYLAEADSIRPFYEHAMSNEGLEQAIAKRLQYNTPRDLLFEVIQDQYAQTRLSGKQAFHLQKLQQPHTFTIVTAHQPNIFTGHLYFIYKILHAIKLANALNAKWGHYHFVPVFYMGSEDADLDELGHIYAGGEKLVWQTQQTGAVGRMHTSGLDVLINKLAGQFGHLPYGKEMIALLKRCYLESENIQQATFKLVNELFSEFGLLVLIPDDARLKRAFVPVMKEELLTQFSSRIVAKTIANLRENYKVQAAGREINLFYLFDDGRRERIEKSGGRYRVLFSELSFTESEMLTELEMHPQRFSPNVILRGMFQETILPNIAFIGGGGELAYWLELKDLFQQSQVPYPVLVLRNSFLLVNEKAEKLIRKLSLSEEELFLSVMDQSDLLVERLHGRQSEVEETLHTLEKLYAGLKAQAGKIDVTLEAHAEALYAKAVKGIAGMGKKMKRAERRKIQDEARQLEKLKELLFPQEGLQERVENFMPFYAEYGPGLLQRLYKDSLTLEGLFTISYIDRD